MFSNALQSELISFFDLDRDEYRESHGYISIDEEKYLFITDTAKKAIKIISSFSDTDGYVPVDENNVAMLWECIDAIHTCMYPRSSWYRESTVLFTYQFLRNFRWAGMPPKYIGYDGWGPLIYELSPEQLAYYLWWREEAKNGIFNVATREYLWLYIYDIVLNTCYDDANQSLASLQKLYDSYEHLSPVVTHKRLSHQKLGYFIVNYALYNGLTRDINRLFKTYGIDDTFNIYHRISNGCFKGSEEQLLSLASSVVKTKTFESSDEKLFVLSILAEIFEQISKICNDASVNLLGDICGTLNDHVLWSPYESPVLYARSATKTVASDRHISFAIGENSYIYAIDDDLSADMELVNNNYSFYYNDNGSRFHCKGFYYRKEYSGPNETARIMIDYVIRRIQISCRTLSGGLTVKELICPYKEIKSKIDNTIHSLVQHYYPIWKQNKESTIPTIETQYKVLAEDQINIPSKYKFRRNTAKHSEASTKVKGGTFMSEIRKAALLQERFDILKDQYSQKNGDNSVLYTLSTKIIIPMLELDFDAGCKMWEYVLSHYYGKCYPVDYQVLTDNIAEYSETKILAKVFRNNEAIKKYVFLLDPYEDHLHCEWFIRDLILMEEYDLADELITLHSQNNHGDNDPKENLFSVLYQTINSSESKWKITSAGIDFLNRWITKVSSQTKRAELEVALLSLIDCVEGNASKGSMPFSMFMAEGGLQMLMEDRLKTRNAQDTPHSFSELIETRAKSTTIKSAGAQNIENQQENIKQKEMFDIEELEKSLIELNSLIGLQEVKTEITSLTNLMRIRRIRSERGMKVPDTSQHLVFSGNPGTGKTTVARIIGKVYHALGFLSKGHLVEVDRSGLVAGYVGQTAIKTQEVVQSALGGILFIDEAYSLSPERSENDFGQEAIDTILKAMEDYRDDFVVIVAGYDNLMPRFIDSNPGLKSRFNKYIFFPDYNGTDLFSIFKMFLEKNDYVIDDNAAGLVVKYLDCLYQNRDENFGNARDVRNLFEKMIANQANRLMNEQLLSDDVITRITVEDLQNIV